jgi:hypothetical protein
MLGGMTPKIETRPVDVKGREIQVKELNDGQLSLMFREARLLQKDGVENGRKMAAVGRIFDILESVVVSETDREYLTDLTVAGELGLADLMGFLKAFAPQEPTKPAVRRRVRA